MRRGRAAQSAQAREAAMFRGGATRSGVYAAPPGKALAGLQWRFVTEGDVVSSPTVLGQTVYVGSGDGRLLRARSNRRYEEVGIRRRKPDPVFARDRRRRGVFRHPRRSCSSPSMLRRASSDGGSRPGALMPWPWGHESGDVYTSSPAFADGTVFFGAGDGRVYAVDAATGKEKWHGETGGSRARVAGGGRIARVRRVGGRSRVRVRSRDRCAQVEVRYRGREARVGQLRLRPPHRAVVAIGEQRHCVRRRARRMDLRDRRRDRERSDGGSTTRCRGSTRRRPWSNGVVYAGSSDAQFVQALDAATGKELWRVTTGTTWSSPAVAGDMILRRRRSGSGARDRPEGRQAAVELPHRRARCIRRRRRRAIWCSSAAPTASVYALRVSPTPVHRAVFFDSAYIKAATLQDPTLVSRYFVNRGYKLLDEKALGEFLAARIADRAPATLVFAVDHVPPSAVDTSAIERSPLRRFLDVGGKVVWPGVPPLLFPRDPKTGDIPGGLASLKWGNTTKLLGVPHEAAMFDQRGVRVTDAGKRWGLQTRWRTGWGIAPDKSITVLGLNEFGLASAWVRRYAGPEGTGFVRVPPDDMMTMFLAAEYRPSK